MEQGVVTGPIQAWLHGTGALKLHHLNVPQQQIHISTDNLILQLHDEPQASLLETTQFN